MIKRWLIDEDLMPTHSRRNEPFCTLCTTAECNSTKLWVNWSLYLLYFWSTKYLSKARWYLFHFWWSGNPCDTRSQLILLNRVGLQWIPRVVLRHHGLSDLLFPSPGLDCISNDLWLVLIIYSPIMVYDDLYDRLGDMVGADWLSPFKAAALHVHEPRFVPRARIGWNWPKPSWAGELSAGQMLLECLQLFMIPRCAHCFW